MSKRRFLGNSYRYRANAARRLESLPSRKLRCEPLENRRLLAVVTVNTTEDVVDLNDGRTSLREAIFAANVAPGHDEIIFDFGHDGPAAILLTQGELHISDSLAITGRGAAFLTIDASGSDPTPDENSGDGSRAFRIDDGVSSTAVAVTIEGLTVTGGDTKTSGGGIFNLEDLTLRQVVVKDNSMVGSRQYGGGIFTAGGMLAVIDSLIIGNSTPNYAGGGIAADNATLIVSGSRVAENESELRSGGIDAQNSQVTIVDTVIEANHADGPGGGLSISQGALLMQRSTVRDNSSNHEGGGLSLFTEQGAIVDSLIVDNRATVSAGGIRAHVRNGLISIWQSTLAQNEAPNGSALHTYVSSEAGRIEIAHSTVSENEAASPGGGAIHVIRGPLNISHSIIAGNAISGQPEILLQPPSLAPVPSLSVRYSLIGTNVGAKLQGAPVGSADGYGNLIGSPEFGAIDPQLGPLADNGGPTFSYALLPGSPAINAGGPSPDGIPEFDQRGEPFARVFAGRIDIGAYERQAFVVDSLADEDDGHYGSGNLSLREAIDLANQIAGANSIEFSPELAGGTILLTRGELLITDSLAIAGLGPESLAIDASGNDPTPAQRNGDGSRVFRLSSGRGPLIEASIAGVRLTGGDASGSGGAVESFASLTLTNVDIVDNHAAFDGGGLSLSGVATLENTTIRDNHSDRGGGGVRVNSGADVTIRHSKIAENSAGSSGGGLMSSRLASTKIYDSTVDSNVAANSGGGMDLLADRTTISRTSIVGNAANQGAGVNTRLGNLQLEDSVLAGNQATGSGGALRSDATDANAIGTVFINNRAVASDGRGGAIDFSNGQLSLIDCTMNGNFATESQGGALSADHADLTIEGGEFVNNFALEKGGGIWAESSLLRIDNAAFSLNRSNDGGAIYASRSMVQIEGSLFVANSAKGRGGAIVVDSSTPTSPPQDSPLHISNSEFRDNKAGFAGGAVAALLHEDVDIRQCLFRGNAAQSADGAGGGGAIYALSTSEVAVSASVFQDNRTPSNGGAMRLHGAASIESCLIIDNHAGLRGGGAALLAGPDHDVRIESTSLVRNRAGDDGGAIFAAVTGTVSLVNCTISQNDAVDLGGGIYFLLSGRDPAAINRVTHSTIAFNRAGNGGAGVFAESHSLVNVDHSIIFGNETNDGHQDIAATDTVLFDVDYALIGTVAPGTPVSANHLLLGVSPQLRPLAPYGVHLSLPDQNRLLTHALAPNSPAVDAGDPNVRPGSGGTPEFDQRGAPFSRVAAGNATLASNPVIDLGAFEFQPLTGSLHGDFDGDERITGHDFLIWQRNVGNPGAATHEMGDATGNGVVGSNDLAVWLATYGKSTPDTGDTPRQYPMQSASVQSSAAVFSAASLQLGEQHVRRDTLSTASTVSRLESADRPIGVPVSHKVHHRNSPQRDSAERNSVAIRGAAIDIALENSIGAEFAELVDDLFAR